MSVVLLLRQRETLSGGSRAVRAAASFEGGDARKALGNFAEEDFLRRCSASYCDLNPPPRSTIATAFSPDGRYLASTQCVTLSLSSCASPCPAQTSGMCAGALMCELADISPAAWLAYWRPVACVGVSLD